MQDRIQLLGLYSQKITTSTGRLGMLDKEYIY